MKRIILCMLPLLAIGCSSRQHARICAPVRVETWLVTPSASQTGKSYVGVIEEGEAAALSFPLGGTLTRLCFDEGQRVGEGALLAQLDDRSARESYEAARATLEQARDACLRLQRLHDENSLPEIQWVEVQTKLRQAEAAFAIAEKNLADCSLRAPFAGVVGKRTAAVGETALPGVPVITVLKTDRVKVRFPVPEQEIGTLSAGDRIVLSVAALGGRSFTAGEMEKGVVSHPSTHTYDVRGSVTDPSGELLPGMVCRVDVLPQQPSEEITVPLRAVQQAGDGSRFVWSVRDSTAFRTPVEVGALNGNRIAVTRGLEAGERIVTEGMQKIGEGTRIVWQ